MFQIPLFQCPGLSVQISRVYISPCKKGDPCYSGIGFYWMPNRSRCFGLEALAIGFVKPLTLSIFGFFRECQRLRSFSFLWGFRKSVANRLTSSNSCTPKLFKPNRKIPVVNRLSGKHRGQRDCKHLPPVRGFLWVLLLYSSPHEFGQAFVVQIGDFFGIGDLLLVFTWKKFEFLLPNIIHAHKIAPHTYRETQQA